MIKRRQFIQRTSPALLISALPSFAIAQDTVQKKFVQKPDGSVIETESKNTVLSTGIYQDSLGQSIHYTNPSQLTLISQDSAVEDIIGVLTEVKKNSAICEKLIEKDPLNFHINLVEAAQFGFFTWEESQSGFKLRCVLSQKSSILNQNFVRIHLDFTDTSCVNISNKQSDVTLILHHRYQKKNFFFKMGHCFKELDAFILRQSLLRRDHLGWIHRNLFLSFLCFSNVEKNIHIISKWNWFFCLRI